MIKMDTWIIQFGLTNRPPNTWTHTQSKVKAERPHMTLQWASEVAIRGWDDHPRIGSAPTCKETQKKLMPTIGWKLTQVEGWMSLSHGSKGPPSVWITSNRCETALEEQHHTVHHTMAADPMPGDKIPGRPASPRPAGLLISLLRTNATDTDHFKQSGASSKKSVGN